MQNIWEVKNGPLRNYLATVVWRGRELSTSFVSALLSATTLDIPNIWEHNQNIWSAAAQMLFWIEN